VNALIAVLAGGTGARLGGSKPEALLAGRPLIERPVEAALATGLEVAVFAKPDTPLPPLDARVVREPAVPRHPLAGILAALAGAGGRPVVVVAGDMPLVPPALLAWLASHEARCAVPLAGGRLHPLLARYDATCEPVLADAGKREEPLTRSVERLDPALVTEDEIARFGDPARVLFNVNTPDELAEAGRLLAEGA
jgi:molybdopterin-guanine dinucleotide biosynthesis protein A